MRIRASRHWVGGGGGGAACHAKAHVSDAVSVSPCCELSQATTQTIVF